MSHRRYFSLNFDHKKKVYCALTNIDVLTSLTAQTSKHVATKTDIDIKPADRNRGKLCKPWLEVLAVWTDVECGTHVLSLATERATGIGGTWPNKHQTRGTEAV